MDKNDENDAPNIGKMNASQYQMTVEEFALSHEGPALLVNHIYLASGPSGIRMAFAEQLRHDIPPSFRTAVVMSRQEAIGFYKALELLIKEESAEHFRIIAVKPASNNMIEQNESGNL